MTAIVPVVVQSGALTPRLMERRKRMDIQELTTQVEEVSQGYASRFGINRDANWFILKLQEEIGELTQAHLMLTGQARTEDKDHREDPWQVPRRGRRRPVPHPYPRPLRQDRCHRRDPDQVAALRRRRFVLHQLKLSLLPGDPVDCRYRQWRHRRLRSASNRLLETWGRRCGLAGLGCLVVALRGPGGLGSVTACRLSGLAFERRAGLPGPCRGVAQKRRERLSGPGSRRARCGPH